MIGPLYFPHKPRRQSSSRWHMKNLSYKGWKPTEFVLIFHFLTSFRGQKLTDETYEAALENQTIRMTYDNCSDIIKNKKILKEYISNIESKGIFKRLTASTYLINPLYAENVTREQIKFLDEIMIKEFGYKSE